MLDRSSISGTALEIVLCLMLDPRVTWAITEMQRRLADNIDLVDIAAAVNLSRSRFYHLFRLQTGLSPTQYLRAFRLDRARLLLETTTLTVREIMALVGVHDSSHFSRDFRHVYGVSPRIWREQCRDGDHSTI